LAVLGGAGLAISFCAPRANAEAPVPPWTNANYANRYICNVTSTVPSTTSTVLQTHFTGIMKLNSKGNGLFQGGTLDAALIPFTNTGPSGNATQNFCTYSLDPSSIYSVNQDGTAGESLIWDLGSGNNGACPASFTMSASFVLRNNVTDNNTVPRADMTTDNFLNLQLGQGVLETGHGYCLK
jgi:hypothetical protein